MTKPTDIARSADSCPAPRAAGAPEERAPEARAPAVPASGGGGDPSQPALDDLTRALEHMQLGVTITDPEGRILYTNPAEAAMHGYTIEELLGQDIGIFSDPEDRRRLTQEDLRTLRSWRRESVNIRKDGSPFPVQLLSDVVRDGRGEPIGVVTTCEDITARKDSERALKVSRDELDHRVMERTKDLYAAITRLQEEMAQRRQADEQRLALEAQLRHAQRLEAIGQLTGGIAHDFNNLLSVILANAELVATALPAGRSELRTSLDDIIAAARSGATMVHQLLGFSRQVELTLVPTDLRIVVVNLADMLRRVIGDDIDIQTYAEPPVGVVRADHGAIQQILMNLVTNARDAMPTGGSIRIALRRAWLDSQYRQTHPWVEPGEYLCLSVSDNGVGMDAETKDRIFDPFFTTKPPGKGTGLGMAMVYGLMKQHRGHVHVYSEPGEGTTVSLYFAAIEETIEEVTPPADLERPPRGGETILLAEDEEALRRTAQRALEKFGYRVLTAATGAEALALFRKHRADISLVVSDLMMPKMGGRELHDAIRREGSTVKFALASGYTARDVEMRTMLGAEIPVVTKPWTLRELAEQVRAILDEPV